MKPPTPTFEADVVDRKMVVSDRERESMARWVRTFKNGTHLEITVRKHKEKRSNLQNSYYWATVVPILADFFGHDNAEDMHEDLKLKFNPVESKIESGKMIGGTTTKMDTVEFYSHEQSYVERICRWASTEYGLYIPPPNKERLT